MSKIEYTITTFRKNMRQAFNEADNGRDVYIERYGQTYQLASLVRHKEGSELRSEPDTKEDNGLDLKPAIILHTTKDILIEISQLERQRDSELEYCQDSSEARKITTKYKDKIQLLWDEYHELKEDNV